MVMCGTYSGTGNKPEFWGFLENEPKLEKLRIESHISWKSIWAICWITQCMERRRFNQFKKVVLELLKSGRASSSSGIASILNAEPTNVCDCLHRLHKLRLVDRQPVYTARRDERDTIIESAQEGSPGSDNSKEKRLLTSWKCWGFASNVTRAWPCKSICIYAINALKL